MRLYALVVLAGCGFTHGTSANTAGDGGLDGDPLVDASPDGPPTATCYDRWLAGTIRFDPPAPLATVNAATYDRDPFLTADELTLYFSSSRPTTSGATDVWKATRASLTLPFGIPMRATEFDSTSAESKLSISADGLVAVVGSDRPGSMAGSLDVWEAVRGATTDPWPAMSRSRVQMLETNGSEHDPTISADGNRIYLAPDTVSPQRIVMATRQGGGNFAAAVEVAQLNGGNGDGDPSPTPDERILVFTSNRTTTGANQSNLYYATRASSTDTFGTPHPVPDLNTNGLEGDPHLSSDGCRLYFGRDTGMSGAINQGDWDLFVATAKP